jgi:hypothetical protein
LFLVLTIHITIYLSSPTFCTMKSTIFWNVMPCRSVEVCQYFRGMLPPLLALMLAAWLLSILLDFEDRKLINFYQTIWCHIPEDITLRWLCCENLKSHIFFIIFLLSDITCSTFIFLPLDSFLPIKILYLLKFQKALRDKEIPHLLPQISDILENINRQMLLILKTNDLMRGVEFTLKAQNR